MENTKNKKQKIVWETKTSKFSFTIPIILFIGMILYMINGNFNTNLFIYFLIFIGVTIKFFLLYYKKKLVITENKIYIYIRGKKFISWSLSNEFYMVNYKQNKFGKMFHFGTLTLINRNKDMYDYYFIAEPIVTYEIIIETYEKLMKKLDPSFVSTYKKESLDSINNLDKIEDNEK